MQVSSAFRVYNAYFHQGRNPYSSAGSISTIRGIEPLEIGVGAVTSLDKMWGFGPFQPYFGASGVGGQSKVIRDSMYDPDLNEQLRERINRPPNAPLKQKFFGTEQRKNIDLDNPEYLTDTRNNTQAITERPPPLDIPTSASTDTSRRTMGSGISSGFSSATSVIPRGIVGRGQRQFGQ